MKMTKIESARIIAESTDNPVCRSILCSKCFNSRKGKACKDGNLVAIEKAKAYIKRHESKTKKKDHIRDTTKKVESTAVSYEPCVSCRNNHGLCSTKERTANVKNCVSYDPIIKKKVEEPKPVEEPTPLEIAKMIRDNGYVCLYIWNCRKQCPISNIKTGQSYCSTNRKKLIDDYISANEPKPVKTVGIDNDDVTLAKPTVKENLSVPCEHLINGDSCGNAFEPCDKDCPANEYPQPIKFDDPVPEYAYYFNGISTTERIAVSSFSAYKKPDSLESFAVDVIGRTYPLTECYRTLEEAVIVAKKLWKGEGK